MDVEKLLRQMTLREKILQLEQLTSSFFEENNIVADTGPATSMKLREGDLRLVGTILNSVGADRMKRIQKEYLEQNPHKIPLIFMVDVIHGYRTIYPVNLGLASGFDMELVKDCASMAAKEASVDGIHVTFAPMVDIARDARWGRVAEGAGEDPYLSSLIAKASVEGYQGEDLGEYKIAACVKHFAAYGAAEAGRDYNTVDMSERTLREYFLPPYKAAVDAGASLVMSSFNVFDGMPVVGNQKLLRKILREEWGYDGVVISDYGAFMELIMHGVAEDEKEAAALAFKAGCDIEMMTTAYGQTLEELIEKGVVEERLLDESVLRILQLKEKLGLFENPFRLADAQKAEEILLCKEHRELARYAAAESAVLLKNEGILPFGNQFRTVAVIGPLADNKRILGIWKCMGREEEAVSVYEGICNVLGEENVFTAPGCSISYLSEEEDGLKDAVHLAGQCDAVVLCLGEDQDDSGESSSKAYLELPKIQQKLFDAVIKENKNTAVLLFTGRPLAIRQLKEKAPAVLNMWFPGTEGGNAAADLLFGKAVPSGKLPVSFPEAVGQCPIYYNHYQTGRPRTVPYPGRAWCQSAYIDCSNEPLYPFGYGLSYTDFAYGDVVKDKDCIKMGTGEKLTVSVTVKNTGKYDAKETVQLYIRDLCGSVVRPVKELKGFRKLSLKAGQQETVSFEITEDMLAFYNEDLVRKAQKGKIRAWIGTDSSCREYVEFDLV